MTGRVLLDLLDMTSLVTATVQVENNNRLPSTSNEKLANGVNVGTNYRVYGIDKVNIGQTFSYSIGKNYRVYGIDKVNISQTFSYYSRLVQAT
jgi:hypothetical protein